MATIDETGYTIKTQNQWFADEKALYQAIDPNWNLDPSSPDGEKIANDSEIFANLDEVGLRAYNSKDPNKAQGKDLEVICALTGTSRSEGTYGTVTVTLSGVAGTVIVNGQVGPQDGSTTWTIKDPVTLDGTGSATAIATCDTIGAIQANPGTITRIVTTVGGWQSVTNSSPAVAGTPEQNDSSLRIERKNSVSKPGSNQIDSLIGELLNTSGVKNAIVLENYTDVTDSNGLPKNSIAPIVDGGTDGDVAKSIFRKKNPGCNMHAAGTPVTVNDVYVKYPFNTSDITFSRPIYVDMIVTVTIGAGSGVPDTDQSKADIKKSILDYVNGTLIDSECGFNSTGFTIGQDVPVSRVATPVNQYIGKFPNAWVSGMTVNTLTFGQTVSIAFNEISRWSESNITVAINV
jgi:uncharacterized phage protein gp47/JayE